MRNLYLHPTPGTKKMAQNSVVFFNPQTIIYKGYVYQIKDLNLVVYVVTGAQISIPLPLTTIVDGKKIESHEEIELLNLDVIDKRCIGIVDDTVIYTNSLDIFRVKFNSMTKQVEFIHIKNMNPKHKPNYYIAFVFQ